MSERERMEFVRGIGMILVVVGHALLPYASVDVGWVIHQPVGNIGVDGGIWLLHSFLMPLFFLLAGVSVRNRLESTSALTILARVWLPFLVLVVPMSYLLSTIWTWGNEVLPRAGERDLAAIEHASSPVVLGHLWFLYYLAMSVLVVTLGWRVGRVSGPRVILLSILVAAGALVASQRTEIGTPQGFVPDLAVFAFHFAFFFAGFAHVRLRTNARALALLTAAPAALGIGLFLVLVPTLSLRDAPPPAWASVVSVVISPCLLVAVLAACSLVNESSPIRALAGIGRHSFVTYIVHVPVVAAVHVLLARWPLPVVAKVFLATSAGLGVGLAASMLWRVFFRRRAAS